jgi:hypothetical protein
VISVSSCMSGKEHELPRTAAGLKDIPSECRFAKSVEQHIEP